jgi:lipoprotein-anchoring transpeptidase ErfK/SrfK
MSAQLVVAAVATAGACGLPPSAQRADAASAADTSPQVTPDGVGRTVVTIGTRARLYAGPYGPPLLSQGHAVYEDGSAWVLRRRGRWLAIPTVHRPNGALGWIRQGAGDVLSWTQMLVQVDLSTRRVRVSRGRQLLMGAPVAVGAPRSPSPTGVTSVSARIDVTRASGFADTRTYGPVIVALRRWQPYPSPGRPGGGILAFHGGNPGSIGLAASGGCFRMRTSDLLRLARLAAPGTPVIIRP